MPTGPMGHRNELYQEGKNFHRLHDGVRLWVFHNPLLEFRLMATDGTTMVFGLAQQTRC